MILLGIAGGSGSGKTTLAREIFKYFGENNCCIISQDNYYRDQSHKFDHDGGAVNFDHPDAIDFELLTSQMAQLKNQESIQCPIYDFATHKRKNEVNQIKPKKIVILDGILIFTHSDLIDLFHHKIFTDCPEHIRFERRLKRDIEERGRTPSGVKIQFEQQVKPMHDEFVQPSASLADLIIQPENFDQHLKSTIEFLENELS